MTQLVLFETRMCSKCGKNLPLERFGRDKRSGFPLRQCKGCRSQANSAWNRAHRDRTDAATRRWRAKNPEKVAAHKRAWRLTNPDRVRAHKRTEYERHGDKIKARVKRWRLENQDLKNAANARRRAVHAKAAGTGYTTAAHIAARVDLYGGLCVYCGKRWESIDHRIPLARGGSHWPANLIPVCKSCNSRKHDRTEREFREVSPRPHGHVADFARV